MKVIIDTNVLISGIFWEGPPHKILQLWKDNMIELVLSPDILEEYYRVSKSIKTKYPQINISTILEMISLHSVVVDISPPYPNITTDKDDDKFIVCAEKSNTKVVISGDKHLLDVNGYYGIEVLKPKPFMDKYFSNY